MSNTAQRWEIYKDVAGEFRARFRAGNGEIVFVGSEGYRSKEGVNDAIDVLEHAIIDLATAQLSVARARVPRLEVDEDTSPAAPENPNTSNV